MRGPSRLGHLDQYPAQILRGGERQQVACHHPLEAPAG